MRRVLVTTADGWIQGRVLEQGDSVTQEPYPDDEKTDDEQNDGISLLVIRGELGRIILPLDETDTWELDESDDDDDDVEEGNSSATVVA